MNRLQRIQSELNDLFKNKLDDNFIFYELDEDDVNILKVMIIGTKDTPYHNGFYFFTLRYPDNYPNSPPKVWYYTTSSGMRFNPNLYTEGKVCLSILNTWGNTYNWKPIMNTRSVLLSIQSMVLNEDPLKNEPGLPLTDKNIKNYNNVIYYCVFNIAILRNIENIEKRFLENNCKLKLVDFNSFKRQIKEYFIKNINWYIEKCKELHLNFSDKIVSFGFPYFRNSYKCNYSVILNKFIINYENFTDKKLSDIFVNIENINLNNLTIPMLKNICKKNRIKGYSKKNKDGIINLIKEKNEKILI